MKQLTLFADFLDALLPARQAKTSLRPSLKKPAGPQRIEVSLGARTVTVQVVRRTGTRHFTLSLTRDHQAVRLSLPQRASLKDGLLFVQEKRDLLMKWLDAEKPTLKIAPGVRIPFKGVPHLIVWRADLPRTVVLTDGEIHVGGPEGLAGKRVLRWLKAQALVDLTSTTQHVAAAHDIRVTKISVNNAVARWGSCSADGSINYSWRLIFAPDAARHYVVCHELAHRTHMNHSPAFWREVARLGGDLMQKQWFKTAMARLALVQD